MKHLTRNRITAAYAIAIAADAVQIGLFPLFAEGIVSPLDVILDAAVCVLLTRLIGWHYALLPSFIVELLPVADLIPTWTFAVYLVSRQTRAAASSVYAEPSSHKPPCEAFHNGGPIIDVTASVSDPKRPTHDTALGEDGAE